MACIRKRPFSLLEVMVAIFLLTVAAGAIGWNIREMLRRSRFNTSVDRLHARLATCRRLALNCQADWRCDLQWDGKSWTVVSRCIDRPDSLSPLDLGLLQISMNGEKKAFLSLDFTASGEVLPGGTLLIRQIGGNQRVSWEMFSLFRLERGK